MDSVQVQEFVLVIMDGQTPDVQQVFIYQYVVLHFTLNIMFRG